MDFMLFLVLGPVAIGIWSMSTTLERIEKHLEKIANNDETIGKP